MRRIALAVAMTVLAGGSMSAQQRRIGGTGGGAGVELPKIPANPRYPFAGVWVGRFIMEDTVPIAVIIEVADGKYSGATVLPGGARAPHLNSAQSGDAMTWQQTNSGGGLWHYVLKRAAGDTLVGSMTLRDAPNFPPPLPTAKILLVRNPQ
jgi:hypothetical protein